MVLSRLAILAAAGSALAPFAVHAQAIDTTAPALDVGDPLGVPAGVYVGPFRITPSFEARLEYDSNIYAQQVNPVDDFIAIGTARLDARAEKGSTDFSLLTQAQFRQYFDRTSENSTSALVQAKVGTDLGPADRLNAMASWTHAIEDRGDPEARDFIGIGPRELDVYAGEVGYQRTGGRITFGAQGSATKVDYNSPLDDERDLTQVSARANIGYRIAGDTSAVLTGFYTHRSFDLPVDLSGVNRDASTYGARAGMSFGGTSILRGEFSVGVFKFDPKDASLTSYTGVSADASLAYVPTRRIAITLDAFRGDVATVRTGAQSRTDTRIRLGFQAEARHNLRLQGQLFYRESNFRGTGVTEKTKGVQFEAEYRLNRIASIAPSVSYVDRNSDLFGKDFDRFRGAVELRLRF